MIIWQADPGFDQSDGTRAPLRDPKSLAETDGAPDGYQSILTELRNLTVAFKKPVVLVYGDSHYFRVDKPLQDSTGRRLENFTRVETFGDNQANGTNDVHWVKASSTRKAVTSSPFKRRSSPRTASQFQRRSVHEGEASCDASPSRRCTGRVRGSARLADWARLPGTHCHRLRDAAGQPFGRGEERAAEVAPELVPPTDPLAGLGEQSLGVRRRIARAADPAPELRLRHLGWNCTPQQVSPSRNACKDAALCASATPPSGRSCA